MALFDIGGPNQFNPSWNTPAPSQFQVPTFSDSAPLSATSNPFATSPDNPFNVGGAVQYGGSDYGNGVPALPKPDADIVPTAPATSPQTTQTPQSTPVTNSPFLGLTPVQGARITINGQNFAAQNGQWVPSPVGGGGYNLPPSTNTTQAAPNPFGNQNPFLNNVTLGPTLSPDGTPQGTWNAGSNNPNYGTETSAQQLSQMLGLPVGQIPAGSNPFGQASSPIWGLQTPDGIIPAAQIATWIQRGDSLADIRARLGLSGGATHLGGTGTPGQASYGPLNSQPSVPRSNTTSNFQGGQFGNMSSLNNNYSSMLMQPGNAAGLGNYTNQVTPPLSGNVGRPPPLPQRRGFSWHNNWY